MTRWGLAFVRLVPAGCGFCGLRAGHLHCRENLPTIELTQNTFSSSASMHFCILGPAANKMYSYWSTFCNYWPTTLSSRVWGALQTLFGYFDVEIIPQENSKFPFLSYSWTTYSYFHSGFRKSLSCKHLIRQTLLDNVEDDDDGGDNGDDDGDKWKSGAGISFIDQTEFFRQKTHHQHISWWSPLHACITEKYLI